MAVSPSRWCLASVSGPCWRSPFAFSSTLLRFYLSFLFFLLVFAPLLFLFFLLHLFCLHEWKRQECSALSSVRVLAKKEQGDGGYGWAVVAVSKDPTRTKEQYYSDTHTRTHGALAHAWYMYKPRYIRIGITYTGSPTPFLAPSLSRPCSLSLFFLCLCLYLICI